MSDNSGENSLARIHPSVVDVSLSSQEQTRDVEQVANAITQMEQVTQRNAASAEETASAVEVLRAQSATSRGIVQKITSVVGSAKPERVV